MISTPEEDEDPRNSNGPYNLDTETWADVIVYWVMVILVLGMMFGGIYACTHTVL